MNDNKKDYYKIVKSLAWITQFGLCMITPLLLCIFIADFIKTKFDVGGWIMIAAITIGIGGSFMSLLNFIKMVKKSSGNSD